MKAVSADGSIRLDLGILHYVRYGSGQKLLIGFHGYGDDATIFEPLANHLAQQYTFYSFHLPHHGPGEWAGGKLNVVHLAAAILKIMSEHGFESLNLIGYSMGGRVCLSLLQELGNDLGRVVLIAPDGLETDPYYYFFTRTKLGTAVFSSLLKSPHPYFVLMNALKASGVVHASRHKFAMHFLQTQESRQKLHRVWRDMSSLLPDIREVKQAITRHAIPVVIFMGMFDRIIPPKLARRFVASLPTAAVVVLEKGHRLIDGSTAVEIVKPLL